MNRTPSSIAQPPLLARNHRLAAGAAALTTVAASLGALLLAFDGASPARWVRPDAEMAQGLATCEQAPRRAERTHCKQVLAQAALAQPRNATVLARR